MNSGESKKRNGERKVEKEGDVEEEEKNIIDYFFVMFKRKVPLKDLFVFLTNP